MNKNKTKQKSVTNVKILSNEDIIIQDIKDRNKPRSLLFTFITLIIALLGGVPGTIKIYEFFHKTSAKIVFDYDNSRFIPISSHKPELNGKTVLILLRIRIVGTGEKNIYISDIKTSVCYRGNWIKGIRLYPKQNAPTDPNGPLKKYIKMEHKSNADTIVTNMAWNEFKPASQALSYGEPTEFSYACHYDIPGNDRYAITKLRVQIYDTIGNKYETVINTESMMLENLNDVVLIAD
jgi:hypothetical protein